MLSSALLSFVVEIFLVNFGFSIGSNLGPLFPFIFCFLPLYSGFLGGLGGPFWLVTRHILIGEDELSALLIFVFFFPESLKSVFVRVKAFPKC